MVKNPKKKESESFLFLLVRARGLESRRNDAKPRGFRLRYALRSVAALTCHWHPPQAGILYRSPSSPLGMEKRKFRALALLGARGLESRRNDAKPPSMRLRYAPRSVAALTPHRGVIHYRSPSSPLVLNRTNSKREYFRTPCCYWCGQEDLNLHRVAPTRT